MRLIFGVTVAANFAGRRLTVLTVDCQEALMAADISFKNIKRHDVQKIGMAYINHLLEKGDYDTAAR